MIDKEKFHREGFTLIEILIATAIFIVIIVAFISILLSVTQVQVQSSSAAAVNQESQFLLQKLEYYVQTASLIQIPQDTATATLQLYMASSSADPTYITLASGTVYLQQTATGTLQALTSNKVTVSNLSFTRRANPPGHDTVAISFNISYNTSNVAQAFSQLFNTSISQVSAATFDTGVYPSVPASEPLGTSALSWQSINNVIDFSSGNVGINQTNPQQQLEVNGGLRLWPSGSEPTCNSNARGTLWFQSGGAGQDFLYLCAQNASATLSWQQVLL